MHAWLHRRSSKCPYGLPARTSPPKDCLIACAPETPRRLWQRPLAANARTKHHFKRSPNYRVTPPLSLAVTVYSHKFRGDVPCRTCSGAFMPGLFPHLARATLAPCPAVKRGYVDEVESQRTKRKTRKNGRWLAASLHWRTWVNTGVNEGRQQHCRTPVQHVYSADAAVAFSRRCTIESKKTKIKIRVLG